MGLGPLPKWLEVLRRRCLLQHELLPIINQHLRERHSITGDAVRIGAAL